MTYHQLRWPHLLIALALVCVLALFHVPPALAHAQLLNSHPTQDQMLDAAPGLVELVFNEPVTPLSLKLLERDGGVVDLEGRPDGSTLLIPLAGVGDGTLALSWRVVSADGHPIGGTLLFSVGSRTGEQSVESQDPRIGPILWAGKFVYYLCVFGAVGAAALGALVPLPFIVRLISAGATACGLLIVPITLGLHGLDALALPLADFLSSAPWDAALATSYAGTVLASEMAFAAALPALLFPRTKAMRLCGALAAALAALSLALSGHASAASPQWLTRTAVFLHVGGVLFWAGALLPLLFALRRGTERGARVLAAFSEAIPFAVAALVASGLVLAVVQLGPPGTAWLTSYGYILAAKLTLLVALFGLALWNRVALTQPVLAGDVQSARLLRVSISIEIAIVIVVLGLVAGWRFTPPPRALAEVSQAAELDTIHLVADQTMAMLTVQPGPAAALTVAIEVSDLAHDAKSVDSVDIILENEALGIEPIRRSAEGEGAAWVVPGLGLPVGGIWQVTLEVRVSRFELVKLRGDIDIP